MRESEKESKTLSQTQCPICGTVINQKWFGDMNWLSERANFIVECMRGHIFVVRVPVRVAVSVEETKE